MSAPILELRNVTVQYVGADAPTFSGVSLMLPKGSVTALVGPSGTGKSTILHTIAGVVQPTKGDVFFEGENMRDFDQARMKRYLAEDVGLLFQAFHIIPYLTVYENVWMGDMFATKKPTHEEVHYLLEQVHMEKYLHVPTSQLSGGQRQRVALARALIGSPKCILADEPTGNLDPKTGDVIMHLLVHLARKQGSTVLFVTHEPPYVDLADTVLEMETLLSKGS